MASENSDGNSDDRGSNGARASAFEQQLEWMKSLIARAQSADQELQDALTSCKRIQGELEALQKVATASSASAKGQADAAEVSSTHSAMHAQGAEAEKLSAQQAKADVERSRESVLVLKAEMEALKSEVVGTRDTTTTAAGEVAKAQRAISAVDKYAAETQEAIAAKKEQINAFAQEAEALKATATQSKQLVDSTFAEVKESARLATAAENDIATMKVEAGKAMQSAIDAASRASVEAAGAAQAHNLSTTAGLAGAFNSKANRVTLQLWLWGVALVGSLVAIAVIGGNRYTDTATLLKMNPAPWLVAAQMGLTILGVGAPVWLAWMSSRMISRSFALSEDYAYKAALAQAYVGFKEQAKGLDPVLEQRLFAAAISQLDANPVRFVDDRHPGSPFQDLLQQEFMRDVLKEEKFREKFLMWLRALTKSPAIAPRTELEALQKPGSGTTG